MASVGRGWILILGKPYTVKSFCAFLAFLALLVVGAAVGGYLYYQKLVEASKAPPKQIDKEAVIVESKALDEEVGLVDPLRDLFEFHLQATRFGKMGSLVAYGYYESEGVKVDMAIMSREPDRFMQVLHFNGRKVRAALVGGELWVDQSHDLMETEDEQLNKLNSHLMVMECAIPYLAWQYNDNAYRFNFERLEDEEWEGYKLGVLKNKSFDDMVFYHNIDLETGREVRRTATIDLNGKETLLEVIFLEPVNDIEFKFPSGYRVLIDGNEYCTAGFDKYKFNKGIASYLFDKR